MKRVRVGHGKFVTISTEMADKAARVFSSSLTPEQIQAFKLAAPALVSGPMLGSAKPLSLSKPVLRVKGGGSVVTVVHKAAGGASKSPASAPLSVSPRKITAAGALRRRTG